MEYHNFKSLHFGAAIKRGKSLITQDKFNKVFRQNAIPVSGAVKEHSYMHNKIDELYTNKKSFEERGEVFNYVKTLLRIGCYMKVYRIDDDPDKYYIIYDVFDENDKYIAEIDIECEFK